MASNVPVEKNGPHIVVLGGGVIGLSTVSALLCSNAEIVSQLRITVVAKDFSPNTTSGMFQPWDDASQFLSQHVLTFLPLSLFSCFTVDVAGGLWLPYKATHADLSRWCSETLDWLIYLREKGTLPLHPSVRGSTGENDRNPFRVSLVDGVSYEATKVIAEERAAWESVLKEAVKRVPISELPFVPKNANECFIHPKLPLVTTSQYLQYMRKELSSTGRVQFVIDKDITKIEQVASKYQADAVVNCTGLGSRDLLQDSTVVPVRGCLLSLELPPEIKQKLNGRVFIFDDNPSGLTYILPREDACHVGGTYLPNQWDTGMNDEEQDTILNRAIATVPELAQGKIIKRRAGLRPSRPEIRIERDLSVSSTQGGSFCSKPMFFHNYGHGGSGWTVHWGCALTTAKLVLNSLVEESTGKVNAVPKAKL